MKEEYDKLDFVKKKNPLVFLKALLREGKEKPQSGRKSLQNLSD
jgi:hypothetical protein